MEKLITTSRSPLGVAIIAIYNVMSNGRAEAQFLAEREVTKKETRCAVVECHEIFGFMTVFQSFKFTSDLSDKELSEKANYHANCYVEKLKYKKLNVVKEFEEISNG